MNQWLIIYCIINSDKAGHIISLMKDEYFYDSLALDVYRYLCELIEKDITPNLSLVISKFKEAENNLCIEGDIEDYEFYIDNLKKEYTYREIKKLGNLIVNKKDIDHDNFIDYIDKFLNNITDNESENLFYIENVIDEFGEIINQEEELKSKTVYGINEIDLATGGAWPGEYTLVAGRPSMGKSGLLGHIALANAIRGIPTILFSLEMSWQKIVTRMFGDFCDMPLWKLKKRSARTEEEEEQIQENMKKFKKMPLAIDSSFNLDINKVKSIVQKFKMKYGEVGLVCLDYIQMMSGKGKDQNEFLTHTSKGLKGLALQYNVPVIVGSQLSRSCEQREDKRPILSDLRDSGSLEQDADLVFMLYRDYYYNYDPATKPLLEVLIRKFRNGETGNHVVHYDLNNQSFRSIKPGTKLEKIAKRFTYE